MVCTKCGSRLNKTDRKCRFCGEEKPCAVEVERIAYDAFSDTFRDYLIPSTLDIVMAWVGLISAPVFLILGLILTEARFIGVFIITAVFSVFSWISAGYPNIIWSLTKIDIFMSSSAINAEPHRLWSFRRKASYWIFYGIAVILFLAGIFN